MLLKKGGYLEDLIKSLILGIVQGLAEFLPISSSGHLVIFGELLNFKQEGIAFEVFVHLGSLLSVVIVFYRELVKMIQAPFRILTHAGRSDEMMQFFKLDLYIIVATIPAAIIGLTLQGPIERLFDMGAWPVYFMLIITGLLMWSAQFLKLQDQPINYLRALIIGIAQAFAILPGVSRSGSTIFTGMAVGIDREKAARFSFLMSIPAILGAGILKLNDMIQSPPSAEHVHDILAGTITSFIFGYIAIRWLLNLIKKGRLQWFGYYCFAVAAIGITAYFIK